jgi:hypothetical protein
MIAGPASTNKEEIHMTRKQKQPVRTMFMKPDAISLAPI